jgi:hypothetical protein
MAEEFKELLYEKITLQKDKIEILISENNLLKERVKELEEVVQVYESDEELDKYLFLSKLVESIGIDDDGNLLIDEGIFASKSEESKIAKYFIKLIKDKANELNLDAKKIAKEILEKLR